MTTALLTEDTTAEATLAYLDSANEVYKLAKAEHRARLNASSPDLPSWESGGVHTYSRAVGAMEIKRAMAIVNDGELWAALADAEQDPYMDRWALREAAREDAIAEYEQERYESWALRMRVERRAA